MRITSRIYGCANSKSPDMLFEFDIAEELKDCVWQFDIANVKYTLLNELIDRIEENQLVESLKTYISNIIKKPEHGNKWIKHPDLYIAFDDERSEIFISEK